MIFSRKFDNYFQIDFQKMPASNMNRTLKALRLFGLCEIFLLANIKRVPDLAQHSSNFGFSMAHCILRCRSLAELYSLCHRHCRRLSPRHRHVFNMKIKKNEREKTSRTHCAYRHNHH